MTVKTISSRKASQGLQWLELSQSALAQNVKTLSSLASGKQFAACVKANAYGHGLPELVTMLSKIKQVELLTVHSLAEAETVRSGGWTREIILLGPIDLAEAEACVQLDLQPTIVTKEALTAIGRVATKREQTVRTHLKLETGTNRQGLTEEELPAITKLYRKYPILKGPYGLSTHFANIEDTTEHEYAQGQLKEFRRLVSLIKAEGFKPKVRHTACSAALILFDKTHFELVRPGISVYGHWPSKETYLSYRLGGGKNDIFRPVLSWRTRITQIKSLAPDSFVGYGCSYRTTTKSKLAILPVGYYDGYSRGLSNQAYVLIKGQRAPVRGRVCMNLMMVDVTHIEGVKLGEPVTLIGSDGPESVRAEQLALWNGTIAYEILARLSPNIPRLIIS